MRNWLIRCVRTYILLNILALTFYSTLADASVHDRLSTPRSTHVRKDRKFPRQLPANGGSSIYDIPWDTKYNNHPNRMNW